MAVPSGGERFRFEDLGNFAQADDPMLCRPRKFIREAVGEARQRFPDAAGVVAFDDYPASLLSLAIANSLEAAGCQPAIGADREPQGLEPGVSAQGCRGGVFPDSRSSIPPGTTGPLT